MVQPTEVVLPTPPPPDNGRGGLREVGWLAYPVILSQISSTVMGVVDSAMVGRLGATELGAVGFAGIWCWTLFSFFFGTATGVQTFVSQDHGAGREERCGQWAWQTLWLVVPAALLAAGIVSMVQEEALRLLGPSSELQLAASEYLRPRLIGAVGMTLAFVWISFFRGIGDTRTPMIAAILANVVNVGLDYALIFGNFGFPAWGVAGAGIATAVGEWGYALFVFVAAMRWRRIRDAFATAPVRPSSRPSSRAWAIRRWPQARPSSRCSPCPSCKPRAFQSPPRRSWVVMSALAISKQPLEASGPRKSLRAFSLSASPPSSWSLLTR